MAATKRTSIRSSFQNFCGSIFGRLRETCGRSAMRCFLGGMLAVAAAGCSSGGGSPTVYLTLARVPPPSGASPAAWKGPPIAVAPIDLPPNIDRIQLTTATGPATLSVSANAEWAGSLSAMIRLALAQDLAARLPPSAVLLPGDPTPPGGSRLVHAIIAQFMPGPGGEVTLEADWWLAAPNGSSIVGRRRFRVTVQGAATPNAEALTMSRALGRLADAIVRAQ